MDEHKATGGYLMYKSIQFRCTGKSMGFAQILTIEMPSMLSGVEKNQDLHWLV